MSKTLVILIAFYLLHNLDTIQAQNSFYDRTIDGLGNVEKLYCANVTKENVYPNSSLPAAWMLPNLAVIYNSTSDQKYRFDDGAWTLIIDSVNKDDLGLYHCMLITPEDEWFLVKLGLNARGPYYVDLWDTYELNTIIGISAAAGYMLIVAAIYILCRFKPNWFNRCGGSSVDPYDEDSCDDVGDNKSGDVEKTLGFSEKPPEDLEIPHSEKEETEIHVAVGNVVGAEDGNTNAAFTSEENSNM